MVFAFNTSGNSCYTLVKNKFGRDVGATMKLTQLGRGQLTLLCMTIPPILFITLFSYLPMTGWIYSFFDYRIGYKLNMVEFVGLANFRYAFSDPTLVRVIVNTLVISLLGLLGLPLSCAIAILLSELSARKFVRIVQTAVTLPYFMSWVIIYAMVFAFFSNDGLVNSVLAGLGLGPVNVLANEKYAWFIQAAFAIWKTAGYNSIIFFASITGIDSEQFEAARIDGAGRWAKIRYITIPSLMPTLMTLLLIQVGYMLSNGFDQYYVFMNPIVQKRIEVLDYYVYRIGMLSNDIPASTAISMVKTFFSVFLIFSVNKAARRLTGNAVI